MPITHSSGREPWIFRVDHPRDLIGAHRELIASALEPNEKILHLLYSPAWEGSQAPFGISGQSASHGIALTSTRWIISEDRHETWSAPRVQAIRFSQILSLEKGSALLQAWLALRYESAGALQHVTILHKAIGSHHFDDAVRTYRRIGCDTSDVPAGLADDDGPWQHVPRYIAQELMPILIDGEHVLASTRTVEEWHEERRRWKRIDYCVQPWSTFLVTEHGLVYAEAETSRRRGLWAFGTNVWCIPHEVLRASEIIESNTDDARRTCLRVNLALVRGSVRIDVRAAVPAAEGAVIRLLNPHVEKSVQGKRDG